MILKKNVFITTILWGAALIGLSLLSHYSVRGSVGRVDFEIATMLTPAGILRIEIFSNEHYLTPYYSHATLSRQSLQSDAVFFLAYCLFLTLSLFLLFQIKRSGDRRG